ncbi:hypothetical protein BGW41_007739 [Actinomortierella wolfii]|nr:hypothetical protein BGW41_007739 [Actinomortierella wolfii]
MSKVLGKYAGARSTPASDAASFRPSPHRSVNAHAIKRLQTNVVESTNTDTRQTALAQLWQQCSSEDTHVSSLAAQALVELAIQQTRLSWSEIFQGLEDILSAAQGPSLVNTIHAISRLLMSAAKDNTLKPSKKSTADMFKGKNRRHPFIHLVLNKPGVEYILLAQLESIVDGHGLDLAESQQASYRIHALGTLESFVDFCLLDRNERTTALIAPALVNWINRTLNWATDNIDTQEPFVTHLLDYLTTLPLRFPMDRHSPGITLFSVSQSLVDFYLSPSTQSSLAPQLKSKIGNSILLTTLTWTCDMRRYGQTTLPWIQTLDKLVRPRRAYTLPTLSIALEWVVYSYLLMNSPTVVEQELVVSWMYRLAIEQPEPLPVVMANFAFLPLFQVMGESKSENINKRCGQILQVLERTSKQDNIKELETTAVTLSKHLTLGTLGAIKAEMLHLSAKWTTLASSLGEESPLDRFTLNDDITLPSMTLTAIMFHPDPKVRMEAMAIQASNEDARLVTLVLFLYLLRTDSSANVQLFLLQEAIPSLVTSKDEYVTAKVLRTILSLIQGQAAANTQLVGMTGMAQRSKYTHLSAMGVRILYLMWLRQPRVWKTLRQVIYEWVEARTRLHKPPRRGEAAYDMEVSVLTTIRDVCAKNAASHAEVLIPFLATLLKSVELHPNSICLILDSLNISVKANVVEPRAETQVYIEFKQALLENYIHPLLDSKQPKVLGAALRALSSFTAVEIQSILPVESPTLFIRQLILEAPTELVIDEYTLLLNKLARHELSNLRRSLFKDAAGGRSAAHANSASASAAKQSIDRTQLITKALAHNMLQKWQKGAVLPGLRMGYALSNLYCSAVASSRISMDAPEAIQSQQPYRDLMAQIKDIAYTDHLLMRLSAVEGWTARLDSFWIPNNDSQTLTVVETLMPDLQQQLAAGHVPAHCANIVLAMTGIVLSLYHVAHPAATVQASALAQYLLDQYVYPQGAKSEIAGSDEVQFAVMMSLAHITPLAAVDEKLVRTVIRAFLDRLEQDARMPSSASSELSNWAVFAAGWGVCVLLTGLMDSPTRTTDLAQLCRETMATLVGTLESSHASFELTLGLVMGFSRLTTAVSLESASSSGDDQSPLSSNLQDLSEAQLVARVIAMAHTDLDSFLSDTQQEFGAHAMARFLGAPWLIAYSSRRHLTQEEVAATTAKLDQVLLAMTSRRDLQTHLVHITVPYCHTLQINLDTRSPSSSEMTALTSRVHSLVNLIRITTTSAARHTAVLALAACLGIDWCKGPFATIGGNGRGEGGLFTFLASQPSLASVLYSAINTLAEQSGLTDTTVHSILQAEGITLDPSIRTEPKAAAPTGRPGGQSLMSMDLKAGRLAALVIGRFVQLIQHVATQDVGKVIGSSNEPRDYSRLPHSSSWLRALWEGLWEPLQLGTVERAQRQAGFATSMTCLLETVRSLPLPLPAVNWFPLLTQLVALEPKLLIPTIRLASRHAMTSTSLMEYLVLVMANFKMADRAPATASGEGKVALEQTARELLVGEEGLGRLLALAGLPWLNHQSPSSSASGSKDKKHLRSKDRVAVELDRVRGLDTIAKRVHLPVSRAFELVDSIIRLLIPAKQETESDAEVVDREVLQLIFLDTLQHHLPKIGSPATAGAAKDSTTGSSSSNLIHDLRTLLTQVYYQYKVTDGSEYSSEKVLRRLANLSFTSLSHVDALPPVSPATTTALAKHTLREAIGLASLYRAGLLTAAQENRMISVAQRAVVLLHDSQRSADDGEIEIAHGLLEMTFSVLLYAMREGSLAATTAKDRQPASKANNSKKVVWLQRILDLLILMADATPKLKLGIRWLLGGAALLWWDRQEVATTAYQPHGPKVSGDVTATSPSSSWQQDSGSRGKQDADAELLEMLEDDEDDDEEDDYLFGGSDGNGFDRFDPEDENPLMDSLFDEWHACYVEHSWKLDATEEDGNVTDSDLTALLTRMGLVLPDVVLYQAGPTPVQSNTDNPAYHTAKRLLQLAQEHAVQSVERLFFIRLMRRLESLVSDESKWVLLASSA